MRSLLAIAALAACVDTGPGPTKTVDPSVVAAHLLTTVPDAIEPIDVTLGTKVVYLGNTVDKTFVAPGGTVHVKHYWKVLAPPGPGWRVFATLRGAPNQADFVNLGETEMERGHPPETWKRGEIIEDEQDVTVRPDWKSKSATLLVGLIRIGKHGTLDRMAASGPHTLDRAVIARKLDIDLSHAPPPVGTIYIPHAQGPITIDGLANEPGWTGAVVSPEFAGAEGSPEVSGKTIAKMTWDEDNLYVFVSVADTDVYSQYKNHDDPLWKQDSVELFIDADGNRRGYVELQTNPNNATFDSWFAGPRAPKGDEAWDSGMRTAVRVRGSADQVGEGDQGWDVEIAIPLVAVKGKDEAMAVRIPPQVGDKWRLNVNRVDKKSTGSLAGSESSWNRITYADFHALDRMLTAVFADRTGSIVPAAVGGGGGMGSGEGVGSGSGERVGSGSGSGSGSGGSAAGAGAGSASTGSAARVGSGSASAGSAGSGSASAGSGAATMRLGSGR